MTAQDVTFAPNLGSHNPVAYDVWFRNQVQEAIDDPRPAIPHQQVMSQMRELIANAKKRKFNG